MKKKFNPNRIPEERWILLYTKSEGEEFNILFFDRKRFALLKKDTFFEFRDGDRIRRVYPTYALLVKTFYGHDFVLRQFNGEYLATGQELIFKRK